MRNYLVGESITFEADANTDGYLETDHSYSWSIDGVTYASNPQAHAFSATGSYTSSVTATNTVTGGTASASVTVNVVEPANTNWQALAALPPQSIQSPIVASLNDGKALIICGTKSWEFDGATWTPVGDLAYPRYGAKYGSPGAYAPRSVTAQDGRVWVFGNTNLGDVPNGRTIEIYDPVAKTWSLSASVLPKPSGGVATYSDVTPIHIGGCAYVGVIGALGCYIARYQVDGTATAIANGLPTVAFDAPSNTLAPIFKLSDTKIATMCGTTFHVYTLDVTANATPTWAGPFNIYEAGYPFNLGINAIADGYGGAYFIDYRSVLHNALDGSATTKLNTTSNGDMHYIMMLNKYGNNLFCVGALEHGVGSNFFNLDTNTWSTTRKKLFTTTSPSGVYNKFYTGCGLLNGKPIVVGTYPATASPWPAVQFLDFKVSDD